MLGVNVEHSISYLLSPSSSDLQAYAHLNSYNDFLNLCQWY